MLLNSSCPHCFAVLYSSVFYHCLCYSSAGETPSTNFCQIVIQTEKGEYVLCTLVHGVMFQQNLDLKLMPREKVTFSVYGPSKSIWL